MPDKKKTYKEIHGSTRVGDFLRSLDFKKIADVALNVASGDLKGAMEAIKSDPNALTEEQRQYALKLIELDLEDMKGVSQRWSADMNSDSFLSKNVRPLTLIFLTVMTMVLIIGDSYGMNFNVDSGWVDLLKTLLVTVFVAYFGGRSFEKTKRL
jgi:hypothetical protein|tara:strand:- start:548 stop:1009 length:462 start_codon:yes stop_codon:yes gene_type:complete